MQQSKNNDHLLRNASDEYTVAFENGSFLLSYNDVKDHVDKADIRRKKFNWPKIKIVLLKDGLLKLHSSFGEKSSIISIQVEKDKLQIACDCGMQVYKLCCHAYYTIYKLALCKNVDYFQQFVSGGLAEIAFANKEYFIIKDSDEGLTIKSKPSVGKIFVPSESSSAALSNLLKLNLPAATIYNLEVPEEIITGYAIVCSRLQYHPPLLLPFYGKLNNARNDVKTFIDFIRYGKEIPALNFSDDQRVINAVCVEMKKLAEELPAKLLRESKYLPGFFSLFYLWEKVLPLIAKQNFVYEYNVHINHLKQRPRKQYMDPCIIFKERPQLKLQLTIEKERYKLKIIVCVHGKPVTYKDEESFLLRVRQDIYLLSSLKDAMLLEWIHDCGNSITVFNPHHSIFINNFLKQLCEYYPLEFAANSNIHKLKPIKKFIQISDKGRWIILTPFIEYDEGTLTNALTNGTGWLAERGNQLILMQRDKQYEKDVKELIKSLHPDFINQNTEGFYLSKTIFQKHSWFQKIQNQLEKAGIEIKGINNLK